MALVNALYFKGKWAAEFDKAKDGKFTTDDGLFSVETVSCLGACGLAPVVVINEKVYPQMTSDAIKVILDTILQEENK